MEVWTHIHTHIHTYFYYIFYLVLVWVGGHTQGLLRYLGLKALGIQPGASALPMNHIPPFCCFFNRGHSLSC